MFHALNRVVHYLGCIDTCFKTLMALYISKSLKMEVRRIQMNRQLAVSRPNQKHFLCMTEVNTSSRTI